MPRTLVEHHQRPSVLVVAHRIDRDGQGMERLHARLAELMGEAYDVHVLVGAIDAETAKSVTVHRVPLIERPIPIRFMMFLVVASLRLARLRRSVSLVHTCGAIVLNRVDLITVHLCQAAVVQANGGKYLPTSGSMLRRLNTAVLKYLALRVERRSLRNHRTTAAAVSERGREELARYYPSAPRVLTENGVDTSVFFPDQQRRLTTRRVLGIEDSAFVSLLVGGDWALRGVELAIRSLVDLPETSTLIIVGRGDQQQMRMLSQSLRLGHRVKFLGERHDLDDLYRAADALIQMSAYETFSLVLVEAALTKVPLISTNVGVAPVLCGEDHSGGIMVDRDPHALAAAVRSVMENYEVAIHRADVAFDRAQRYSLSRLAHELDVVYQALLETT